MNTRRTRIGAALTGLGCFGLVAGVPSAAVAQSNSPVTYTAKLQPVPLNTPAGAASGTLTLVLTGDQAKITEHVQGLGATFNGAPFPHVQHIHGTAAAGQGFPGAGTGQHMCPTASNDANGDGVISTTEAVGDYGPIVTTLSRTGGTAPSDGLNTSIAPSGSSYTYQRTITLDQQTVSDIEHNNAVIVVHGLNPSNAPANALKEKSPLVSSLPLAGTAPALCGPLVASEMSVTPTGAPQTGGGSTAGTQDLGLLAAGGGLVLGGGGLLAFRRRRLV